jgi:hypothetical protein
MKYHIQSEYNDSCNCHPEMQEIEGDADTVEELATICARAQVHTGEWYAPDKRYDFDKDIKDDCSVFSLRRPLTKEEWEAYLAALPAALEKVTEEHAKERARKETEEKARKARGSKISSLAFKKAELNRLRSDLTAEAIASREAVIKELEESLDK